MSGLTTSAAGAPWALDRRESGGVLTLNPYHVAGELDELWKFEAYMRAMIELRQRLMAGDRRVLYLSWLAASIDQPQDSVELEVPPVPGALRRADELFTARGVDNYEAAAEVLDDLREAIAGDDGEQLTRMHAAHLATRYPAPHRMKSALRKR